MSAEIESQLATLEDQGSQRQRVMSELRAQISAADAKLASVAQELVNEILKQFEQVQLMADKVSQVPENVREVWGPRVIAHYRELAQYGSDVIPTVERAARQGYSISGIDEFRAAVRDSKLLASNADRWLNGLKQLDERRGVSLEEAIDELRRRARAGRD